VFTSNLNSQTTWLKVKLKLVNLQGLPICYSDFTADLRLRMRKVWRDIADMTLWKATTNW